MKQMSYYNSVKSILKIYNSLLQHIEPKNINIGCFIFEKNISQDNF
jgi:hypothetical protein